MQLLTKGFKGKPYRTTESIVLAGVEGQATLAVGDTCYEVGPHDIAVVPAWTTHSLAADDETVVFSYSDRAAQEALGFLREEVEAA